MQKTLRILGIRGVPAAHGGFETFAENLALYLAGRGWRVIVYCQEDGQGEVHTDVWQGIERIRIPISQEGPSGTIVFDWKTVVDAAKHQDLCLTLGYNTAVFCSLLKLKGVTNIINMDGIEWARAKWSRPAKIWFWLNERAGCWLGDHLIADHPEIKRHLSTRVRAEKITTIAYGAEQVTNVSAEPLQALGLQPGKYLSLVARPEPENSILEVVSGFSAKRRNCTLAVLGNYLPDNPYHAQVKAAASDEVKFLGAIYDKPVINAIRFHSMAYVHGHQVGGTNPSLVEALGASNAVIAHDNRFNRWVAGNGARYFSDASAFSAVIDDLLANPAQLKQMQASSALRFQSGLTWGQILGEYEQLLEKYLPSAANSFSYPAKQQGKM